VVYSYNVSRPSEYRSDVRKSMDDFLSGAYDDQAPAEDTREIGEQVPDLLGAWGEMEIMFGPPAATPPVE